MQAEQIVTAKKASKLLPFKINTLYNKHSKGEWAGAWHKIGKTLYVDLEVVRRIYFKKEDEKKQNDKCADCPVMKLLGLKGQPNVPALSSEGYEIER